MSNDAKNIFLTPGQMRAARALLGWSGDKLAEASQVSLITIRRAETAKEGINMTRANMAAIRAALEAAGVEFIPENGGGAGVRLRKPGGAKDVQPERTLARAEEPQPLAIDEKADVPGKPAPKAQPASMARPVPKVASRPAQHGPRLPLPPRRGS